MDLQKEHRERELMRVEGLVITIALLLVVAYILNLYRCRSSFLKYALHAFDAISGSLVTYTIGSMQQMTFAQKDFNWLWVALLLVLTDSVCHADFEKNRVSRLKYELLKIMDSVYTGILYTTSDRQILPAIWTILLLHVVKLLFRMWVFQLADQSYRHGQNSRLVADYMSYEHELSSSEKPDPITMSGYKYLVYGEAKPENKLQPAPSDYRIELRVANEKRLITLEKVWQCRGSLLTTGDPESRLKDLCLSFVLHKLIRRKFDDLHPLPEPDHEKAHQLLLDGLLLPGQDYRRVFRVIEVELAFLNDYFHTLFPVILVTRFILFISLLVFVTFCSCCWLLVSISRDMDNRNFVYHIITIYLFAIVIVKEVFRISSLVFSDWTKLLLLSKYVQYPSWQRSPATEKVVKFLCSRKLVKHWHNKIGQYHILKSFNYEPKTMNFMDCMRLSMKDEELSGAKEGRKITLPEEAKMAIFESLQAQRDKIRNGEPLSNGVLSLQRNQVKKLLSRSCKLKTDAHTILVWHIATALCELDFFRHYNVDATPSRTHEYLIRMKKWMGTSSSGSVQKDDRKNPDKDLKSNYVVASSMSQYCAYLLVFRPQLLREHRLVVRFIFEKTIKKAQETFEGCCNSEQMYDRMMDLAKEVVEEKEEEDEVTDTLKLSAKLGWTLITMIEDEATRWKVLAEFWAEMIIYLAPCDNKNGHASFLESGGEFLTHIWALLHHAGIDKVSGHGHYSRVPEKEQPFFPSDIQGLRFHQSDRGTDELHGVYSSHQNSDDNV
ncbi:uncharacterized protein LOC121985031 [Zingiber officinale]|uniref:uncharacterized protein LOC121985031 n=1 Tax=Zingiber officinale TaxID=94328 RepID=UPI001C4D2067|nr:uncharacterized protein LOC121985031 [Zingiber officinale]